MPCGLRLVPKNFILLYFQAVELGNFIPSVFFRPFKRRHIKIIGMIRFLGSLKSVCFFNSQDKEWPVVFPFRRRSGGQSPPVFPHSRKDGAPKKPACDGKPATKAA